MKKFLLVFSFIGILVLCSNSYIDILDHQKILTTSSSIPSSSPKAQIDFGRMPLYFVPNSGQVEKEVDFYIQGRDKTIYFTSEGLTISLAAPEASGSGSSISESRTRLDPKKSSPNHRWVVKLDFLGANANIHPRSEESTGAVVSYFHGKPKEWITGLPTYSRIVYPNLWQGIDLVYSGTSNRLKYEFIVHPGADPSNIKMAYRGAENVQMNKDGQLEVITPIGSFKDDIPVAYQEAEGKRSSIPLAYWLDTAKCGTNSSPAKTNDEGQAFVYSFNIGKYDQTKTLVLDPIVLIYCGYIGGSERDSAYDIALDKAFYDPSKVTDACAYVTGVTLSSELSFPEKIGPNLTLNPPDDAFVAKVNSSGTGLVYCGYIGGSDGEWGEAIDVDGDGNAYVTGVTMSDESTFPVKVGPDLTFNGIHDGFVAKVNSSGTDLVYCGYIGTGGWDWARGIAVDSSGCAYVVGDTSGNLPGQISFGTGGGEIDGIVTKINAAGSSFDYCASVGGLQSDQANCVAVDEYGCAYVAGLTFSYESSFPVKIGPDLTFNNPGENDDYDVVHDAFVMKVNASGTELVYCGYIGGSGGDLADGIAVFEGYGYAYVAGTTDSDQSTFPVKLGPDLTYNGGADAFVARVDATGSALDFCGYIGGSGSDIACDIGIDWRAYPYVAGYTNSGEATFPVIDGPDLTYNGGYDGFVAKVDSVGQHLDYCGYIGGAFDDYAMGIAVRKVIDYGVPYVAGYTSSTELSFPVTEGPDLTYNGGDRDAFVARVAPAGVLISGKITLLPGGEPIEGVVLSGLPGDPQTDSDGEYSTQVVYRWIGTVTPIKTGYNFNPTSRNYVYLTSDETNQDYTATVLSYSISGYVKTASDVPVQGVIITFSDNGGTAITDSSGYYSKPISYGWSGTATPGKAGYTFSPPSRSYSNVTSDKIDQDYTASVPYTKPSVTTVAVTEITTTTAVSGGNVTSDGGAAVTGRGVCWSTTSNPTTANSHTHDGTGTGSFVSNLTGLNADTAYHIRAYATNSAGTAYGSDVPFTTLPSDDIDFTTASKNLSNSPGRSSRYPKAVSAPGTSNVFAIWVESVGENDALYFSKSMDGGTTWTTPLALSSMSGQILGRSNDLYDYYALSMDVESPYLHVVMQKRTSASDDFEIYYLRSTNLGGSWGSWVQLMNNSADTRHPDVAARSGYVHVTYQDSWPGNNEIMYKRIPNNGGGTADQTRRLTSNSGNSCFPRIAVSKNGDTVHVVYEDNYSGQDQVYYKHIGNSGAGSYGTRQITSGTSWSGLPDIAASTGVNDQYVYIVYQALWPGNREIMYKRLGNYGHLGGSIYTARLTYSTSESRSSSIFFDSDTNALNITYHDNWPGNYDVMYKRLTNYGGAGFTGKRVSWGKGDSSHATVAQSSGTVYVVWADNSAGNYEVLFRKGS